MNRAQAEDCPVPVLLNANLCAEKTTDNELSNVKPSNVDLPSTSSSSHVVPVTNKTRLTLQSILKYPNTCDMFKSEHNLKDLVYYDLEDGLHMKSHPLFSKEKNAYKPNFSMMVLRQVSYWDQKRVFIGR